MGILASVGSAAAFSGSFSGTSLKASANGSSMSMEATGMGVNGFGRIGRLVTRIMMEDEACSLKAINAGSATPDYMAYQYKYDTIHGKAKQTVEVDGDFLILDGKKVLTSRCRDPKEVGWGDLGADYVCESTGVFLTKEKAQSIFDADAGIMLNPEFVKLVAWYDNEYGYSGRVVDLMKHVATVDAKVSA